MGRITRPFFIMYLRERPTYYTNGTETIAVFYTAHARDLEAEGWTRVAKEAPTVDVPDPVLPDTKVDYVEVQAEEDLGQMTKRELIAYAEEKGVEVSPQETKAEILATIFGANG